MAAILQTTFLKSSFSSEKLCILIKSPLKFAAVTSADKKLVLI